MNSARNIAGEVNDSISQEEFRNAPLVSIVTPFHNTHEFLQECIESVLRQSYQNWEYLLIDNGSTDGSSEIAQSYVARNPRKIRLLRTESFLSQVQNYNFALSCISPHSKYCKVVQADDWLFTDCIRSMVEVADRHPTVGIVAAYELEGDCPSLGGLPYPSPEVSGREVCRLYFLKHKYLFGTPTSLLLRSELIRSRAPFYDEQYAPFEDAHACFELLKKWNFGFVHQVLTFSRRDNESILSGVRPFRGLLFFRLGTIVVHGKDYLSTEEYDRCFKQAEREYFFFLGKSVLRKKNAEFWNFHRKALASIHYSLDWRVLTKWVLLVALEYIGNPKRALESLWARRSKDLVE